MSPTSPPVEIAAKNAERNWYEADIENLYSGVILLTFAFLLSSVVAAP
jgi:hypothetical protein